MKDKQQCYFCKSDRDCVAPPHREGVDQITQCDCWQSNPHITYAGTLYSEDELIWYDIDVSYKGNIFTFTWFEDQNCTQLYDETNKVYLIDSLPGHLVTIDNCHEKLKKYLPFV